MNCKNKTVDELKNIFNNGDVEKLKQCLKTLKNSINMKSLLINELNIRGYFINPPSKYVKVDDMIEQLLTFAKGDDEIKINIGKQTLVKNVNKSPQKITRKKSPTKITRKKYKKSNKLIKYLQMGVNVHGQGTSLDGSNISGEHNYKYLSGAMDFYIMKGFLDDNIERTIYLFGNIHNLQSECEDVGINRLDEKGEIIRMTKYLHDSVVFAEDNNFTIDLFLESVRYTPGVEIQQEKGHVSHLKVNEYTPNALGDTVIKFENYKCGQYEKMHTDKCPFKLLRIHYSDERYVENLHYILGDIRRMTGYLRVSALIKEFYNKYKNEYLFLSKEWYYEFIMNILENGYGKYSNKIFKQWENSSSDYLKLTMYEKLKDILYINYNSLEQEYLFGRSNYIEKLKKFEEIIINDNVKYVPNPKVGMGMMHVVNPSKELDIEIPDLPYFMTDYNKLNGFLLKKLFLPIIFYNILNSIL